MNTVKTTVGEYNHDIPWFTGLRQIIENGIGVDKGLGLPAPCAEIPGKLWRGKLFFNRNRIKWYMLANENSIGCIEDTGVVVLENSPAAGVGPGFKNNA